MGTLAVSFQGPFIFSVKKSAIFVYGPDCLNHVAVISTVEAEAEIPNESCVLASDGISPNTGTIDYPHGNIVNPSDQGELNTAGAKFSIQLPIPDAIYGINPDNVEVVSAGEPTGDFKPWVTGLRFYYYSYDLQQPVRFGTEDSPTAYSFGDLAGVSDYADITIEHFGPQLDDPDHKDAIACFGKTMDLLKLSWYLNYPPPKGVKILSRPGADCKSPVVIFGSK